MDLLEVVWSVLYHGLVAVARDSSVRGSGCQPETREAAQVYSSPPAAEVALRLFKGLRKD